MTRVLRTPWALALGVVLFSVAGLVLAAIADTRGRTIGVAILLFFGVGGGAMLLGRRMAGPPPAPAPGDVRLPDGTRQPGTVVAYRRMSRAASFIAGLGMTLGAVVLAFGPGDKGNFDGPLIRIALVVAVVLMGILTIMQLRSAPPVDTISVTDDGLVTQQAGAITFIPWTAIRASRDALDSRGKRVLFLELTSRDMVVRSGPSPAAEALNEAITGAFDPGTQFAIPLDSIDLDTDAVVDLVRRHVPVS